MEYKNENTSEPTEEIIDNSSDLTVYRDFDSMNLNEDLLRGIYGYGYEAPSSIQQRAIKPLIDKKDIVAQSQSGTGKTATFLIEHYKLSIKKFLSHRCLY